MLIFLSSTHSHGYPDCGSIVSGLQIACLANITNQNAYGRFIPICGGDTCVVHWELSYIGSLKLVPSWTYEPACVEAERCITMLLSSKALAVITASAIWSNILPAMRS
jgi:hypothetical protein